MPVTLPQQQRHKVHYALAVGEADKLKQRMLNWAQQFSILCFLDSNNYASPYTGYECLLAAGAVDCINSNDGDLLTSLQQIHQDKRDWIFGHICYDYKDFLEPALVSSHEAHLHFPPLHFFIPETVCYINRDRTVLTIESFRDPGLVYGEIAAMGILSRVVLPLLSFKQVIEKKSYLSAVSKLREHIADGDCYEINFCNEGYCEPAEIDPLHVFHKLNHLSPAPFAAYYRLNDKYLMCASPERYLRKEGVCITSQPIKGTARRGGDAASDEEIKNGLYNDIKERAENVMIVDLVRNDLARSCKTGSVRVDELFGIYTFPQVHQMVSTVSGTLPDELPFTEAIHNSFPMGSMTGAPKYKVMQLIDKYEKSRRELFSGTVGYISPAGDFDFNVIIRSLFYNSATKYLSYQTGGAITYDSNPEQEWEEMRLKAWALERIFT